MYKTPSAYVNFTLRTNTAICTPPKRIKGLFAVAEHRLLAANHNDNMNSSFDRDSVVILHRLERFAILCKSFRDYVRNIGLDSILGPGGPTLKSVLALIEANKIYRVDNNPCEKMASKYGLALPSSKLVRPLSIYRA